MLKQWMSKTFIQGHPAKREYSSKPLKHSIVKRILEYFKI